MNWEHKLVSVSLISVAVIVITVDDPSQCPAVDHVDSLRLLPGYSDLMRQMTIEK